MENQQMNPVGWFEIYVNDMDRATQFYETVLNIKLDDLPVPTDQPMQMRSFPMLMNVMGAAGALVKIEGMSGGGSSTVVYFSCDDCAVEESRVDAAGGKVHQPKMSIAEFGFCSIIWDTEGNMVGLHSLK